MATKILVLLILVESVVDMNVGQIAVLIADETQGSA